MGYAMSARMARGQQRKRRRSQRRKENMGGLD